MNEETKPILRSKTIAGAAIAGGVALVELLFDIKVCDVDSELVENMLIIGGALLAIYGRYTATKKIEKLE